MTTYTLTEDEYQELVNMAKVKNRVGILRLLSALTPNTQEPIGYVAQDGFTILYYTDTRLPTDTELFTNPAPQAKPLTDEQYDELITQVTKNVPFSWRAFARAVEQAHGIGVKP